jgi:acetoin utilization protein AcuB
MHTVSRLMTRVPLVTGAPDLAVGEATRRVIDAGISHLLVLQGNDLVGLVCICDLDQARTGAKVADCMTRDPITVDVATSAELAGRLMVERGISCLPVLGGGALRGVLTLGDLRRAGVVDSPAESCVSCGSTDHVRCEGRGRSVGYCLQCTRRSEPPAWDDDLGGG